MENSLPQIAAYTLGTGAAIIGLGVAVGRCLNRLSRENTAKTGYSFRREYATREERDAAVPRLARLLEEAGAKIAGPTELGQAIPVTVGIPTIDLERIDQGSVKKTDWEYNLYAHLYSDKPKTLHQINPSVLEALSKEGLTLRA